MKLNARRCWLIAGLAVGVMGSSAVAQVAPPPTQPAKEETEYEPQKHVAPATTEVVKKPEAAKEAAKAKQATSGTSPSHQTETLPTSVPYPKLAVKDENGKIIRLTELPDILALRSNPTTGQKSSAAILPVLYGRRARFERLVIDNLDLYWMVTDGRLDSMNLNDIQNMSEIAEMIKPLVGRTTLSQELRSRGILTRTQAGMNEHIVNEYKQSITTEIQFESEEPLSEMMRFILEDSIHETKQAYTAMLEELSPVIGDLVSKAGMTSPAAQSLVGMQQPLADDLELRTEMISKLDAGVRALSFEEGIQLFTELRNLRKNPDISPAIRMLNIMHPKKVDLSDKDILDGYIEYGDGRKVDTRKSRDANNERLRLQKEELDKQREGKPVQPDG